MKQASLDKVTAMASFFIRIKNKPKYFLHPEIITSVTGQTCAYVAREGTYGAAIWEKQEAENIISVSGKDNLELVLVSELLSI